MNDTTPFRINAELLAMLAHDLKNPIGAIFGYADILLDTPAGEGITPKQQEIIGRIRGTSSRCMELIRNYLYLAQSEGNALVLKPVKLDLRTAIQSVVDTTWRDAGDAPNVQLELGEKPAMVLADSFGLERLLANLFNNALQYSPARGEIRFSITEANDQIALTIRNQGNPIPEQDLPFIFDRYFRASNSKGLRGSGLGLYIVKLIADALRIQLSVQSSAEQGTEFTLRFSNQSLP